MRDGQPSYIISSVIINNWEYKIATWLFDKKFQHRPGLPVIFLAPKGTENMFPAKNGWIHCVEEN